MKLIKSRQLGYCNGVRRTIEKADLCLAVAHKKNRNAYSIGNLVHNEDVVRHYSECGMKVIDTPDGYEDGVALIRAHGIPDSLKERFANAGFELIDSTCPKIIKSFEEIKKAFALDRTIIVIGMPNHAETDSLMGVGYATRNIPKYLVSDIRDIEKLKTEISPDVRVSVIVQTTFPQAVFSQLSCEISTYFKDSVFCTTLCPECIERKKQVSELSGQCDAVVVIGSGKSANTQDLVKYAENTGKPVFSLANINEMTQQVVAELGKYRTVGICSGTSTPEFVIEPICSFLSDLN